ncbi:MAG: hypothetical protein ACPG32_03165 [Akkermansiaceae bacterium]
MKIHRLDGLLIRIINRVVLLHLCICVGAIAAVIMLPFSIWDFVQSSKIPSKLLNEASIETVYLVDKELEGWNSQKNTYVCFLDFNPYIIRHERTENPKDVSKISIYKHEVLHFPPDSRTKIIEVPEPATWNSVYLAAHSRPLWQNILTLAGQITLTALGVYVAIRGYWLIKHGERRV